MGPLCKKMPDSIEVRVKEVRDANKRMNSEKSPRMSPNGIKVERLKTGKEMVTE